MSFTQTKLLAFVLIVGTAGTLAAEEKKMLFAFDTPDAAKEWVAVNDGVMGGVSDGRFKVIDAKTMEFFGTLSLENNGGFASVRSKPKALGLTNDDSIVVRVRGDGREYTLNLYVPTQRIAFSYRATIKTKAGEWVEVSLPLRDFYATSFGNKVPDAGSVDAGKVNALGFLLSDKKAGPFKLEVEWIKAGGTAEKK
jgi:NADH dehydrogenase [ubiquinone] 1 alpha subcomplex assembly factor 1